MLKYLHMEIKMELEGWALFFSIFKFEDKPYINENLIEKTVDALKNNFKDKELSKDEIVIEIRRLFHKAGCDPTKYRPSFEALARRILRGEEFPRINPQVDFCNILSLKWHIPCCICDLSKLVFPLKFRRGNENETFESLRGPFSLKNKPLIEDKISPFSTPITDSIRTKVNDKTEALLFISYFPSLSANFEKIKEEFYQIKKETSFKIKEIYFFNS